MEPGVVFLKTGWRDHFASVAARSMYQVLFCVVLCVTEGLNWTKDKVKT